MSYPAEIRAEMGRQGIKPSELAERAKMSPATISRKVTAETRDLSMTEALALAEALDVPAWELMRRADKNAPVVA